MLTKLALRWDGLVKDETKQNRFTAECMLLEFVFNIFMYLKMIVIISELSL